MALTLSVLDQAPIPDGSTGAQALHNSIDLARLAGLNPTGTMPHSLVLIFGDTVRAAEAFDRELGADVSTAALVVALLGIGTGFLAGLLGIGGGMLMVSASGTAVVLG